MRYLVTGGTGFIGSNIVYKLLEDGHEVVATGRSGEQQLPKDVRVLPTFIGIDFKSLGSIDAVFHQAAIVDTMVMDRNEMFKVNFDGTKSLFENAAANGVKNIVYASSTAVLGDAPAPYTEETPVNPLNPYAESKRLVDDYARIFSERHPDTKIVGLRYCNVYGPGESHKGKMATQIYQLAQQMVDGNPKLFKSGEQRRDWIYVKDVVRANLLAAKSNESFLVNCGSGKAVTFNELISILNKVMGTNRVPQYINNPHAARYQSYTECDMTLAKTKLGFVPEFDVYTGIPDFFASGALVPKQN